MDMRHPTVTKLLETAFTVAAMQHADLHGAWVRRSIQFGGLLPASSLMMTVQRLGRLDLVLRSLEIERAASNGTATIADSFMLDQQMLLSEAWIGAAYEVLRLLIERDLAPQSVGFRSLAHDLRLIRIPLEKHEIAADRKLKEPLRMARQPGHGDARDFYDYVPGDKTRAHIMPTGLSQRGSASWQAIDLTADETNRTRWLERLELSERFLATEASQS